MKKIKTIASIIAASLLAFFVSCAGDSGSGIKPEVEPGTIGQLPQPLIDASELAGRIDPTNSNVILFYYEEGIDYNTKAVYNWTSKGDETKNVPFTKDDDTGIGYANFSTASLIAEVDDAIAADENFNIIIKSSTADNWDGKTKDLVFPLSEGTKHLLYYKGDLYTVEENMKAAITKASMQTLTTMRVELGVKYGLNTFADSNGFTLSASDGTNMPIIDVVNFNAQNDRSKNNANVLLVTLSSALDLSKIWSISHGSFGSKTVVTNTVVKISLKDYVYEGNDLGLTLVGNKAIFKVWAPLASDVKLLVYSDVSKVGTFKPETVAAKAIGSTTESQLLGNPALDPISMTLDKDSGIWTYEMEDSSSYKYYKYQIVNNGTTYYVSDIYAKACSADSIASQIVDINASGAYGTKDKYVNPFGNNGTSAKAYSDAVIYEMHIREWSRAVNSRSTGKFNEMCDDTIINHLKDLGITHVQILPCFDYAQVVSDSGYNWGYNPYHYNVPEGRYTDYSSNKDGTAAVDQMRAMIKKFHDNGISVIMDVVYNHTSGTQGGSLYDSTVPYYYYRIKTDGSYANGSGCGNETDSDAPMFRKYMIDTLKHWMLDYHVNGFRFDLMGVHSKEAMTEIYKELSAIDPNVMVYGEPWTGGDSLVKNTANSTVSYGSAGVGAFDDDFRDAVKGAEFGGFNAGQVQGVYNDSGIATGLTGAAGKNKRNTTGKPELALHYVECHDNFTLYDKLVYSLAENINATKIADGEGKIATVWPDVVTEEQLALVRKEDKLAAAFVLLSQGTPFINGGQEFLRTKKGDPDSYAADEKGGIKWTNTGDADDSDDTNIDKVNEIVLSMKTTNSDVYNTYKGLIALRKANSESFGRNSLSSADTAKVVNDAGQSSKLDGVIKYTTGNFVIIYNSTETDVTVAKSEISSYTTLVDISTGTPVTSSEINRVVPAKSFIILKK